MLVAVSLQLVYLLPSSVLKNRDTFICIIVAEIYYKEKSLLIYETI